MHVNASERVKRAGVQVGTTQTSFRCVCKRDHRSGTFFIAQHGSFFSNNVTPDESSVVQRRHAGVVRAVMVNAKAVFRGSIFACWALGEDMFRSAMSVSGLEETWALGQDM